MPSFLHQPIRWLYNEFGIASVYTTGRDAWLIILARTCRMFAFGAISIIIALFFSSLNFSDFRIGLFMTLTLAGDVILSLLLALVADQVGRRRILFMGGLLMVLSGTVFAFFNTYWVLLLAAIIGVVSATGGDFGPFRSIEESTLSHLTTPSTRSDVLSWYVTTSSLGSAIGTEISGRVVALLRRSGERSVTSVYHSMFWIYVIMGFLTMVFSYMMSGRCEISPTSQGQEQGTMASEPLLNEEDEADKSDDEDDQFHTDETEISNNSLPNSEPARAFSRFGKLGKILQGSGLAQISRESRPVVYKLWFLLTVDSLADGMVSYALTNYYLARKFKLAESLLGDIMSISYFLMAISTIFAGPLARRLGLINTMVFTHIPSSAAVLLFPIPQSIPLTIVLLFIRTGLNNMDQAPRAAFIAAVVKPAERTAVMGITGTLRTLASTVGPSLTGWLAGTDRFWIAFVIAGILRLGYDFGLFFMFVGMKIDDHSSSGQAVDSRRLSDEEDGGELELDDWDNETPRASPIEQAVR